MIRDWIMLPNMVYLHCEVPCGAASRAREIQVYANDPQPLRDTSWPEGLPGLSPRDAERVATANAIYQFAASAIIMCHELGKDWSLEQPHRSLFWQPKYWKSVVQHVDPVYVKFDHCMVK